MRVIGHRTRAPIALRPSAAALRNAAIHQAGGRRLAPLATTGIVQGVYRFASHAEMNRATDEATARAIALNVRRRRLR
jgi:hypothetical protein